MVAGPSTAPFCTAGNGGPGGGGHGARTNPVVPIPRHFQLHLVATTMLRMVSLVWVVVEEEALLLLQALTPQVVVDLVSS